MKRKGAMAAGVAGLVMLGLVMLAGVAATPIGRQVVSRDAFPVFDDPEMVSALDAERRGLVRDRDAVIGVAHGGEAKAYPVTVMGVHELGNDTLGGVPIAVSW